jgi:hypothetical protein
MGKRALKKQHKNINLNVIDLLANLDPTEGNKFLPFLVNKLKSIDSGKKSRKNRQHKDLFNPINSDNGFQNVMSQFLMDMVGGSLSKLNMLNSFEHHMIDKRIDNTDITTYKSWKQIEMAVEVADIKLKEKELKATTQEIFKSDEWLVIRPLSFESSKTYGANTKWCTTMEGEKLYFYKYCKGGLIYVINRMNGEKFGFYNGIFDDSNVHELTVWDAVDNRIDSMLTDVPLDIMYIIKEAMHTQNIDLMCDGEKEKYTMYMGGQKEIRFQTEVQNEIYEDTYEEEVPMDNMEMGTDNTYVTGIIEESEAPMEESMEESVTDIGYLRNMLLDSLRPTLGTTIGTDSSTYNDNTSITSAGQPNHN